MAFSRVKTIVHPDYARFEDFVRRLPQENFPIDRVFCDRRNTVVATHDQAMSMVVKKYARPTLFNCFVYTFFRPSKAERAYRYALRLARCGVETAAPIGYVHVYRGGIFHTGYFLCRFLPYPTLSSIKNSMKPKSANSAKISWPLPSFCIDMGWCQAITIRGTFCITKTPRENTALPW